jgi:hypothetical protein
MPFTLAAFYSKVSTAGWNELTPVSDPILRSEGTKLYVPELNKICAIQGIAEYTNQMKLDAPSLKGISPFYLNVIKSAVTGDHQIYLIDLFERPKSLVPTEPLKVLANVTDVTADRNVACLVFFGDGDLRVPAGELWCVQATASGTAGTAWAWNNLPLVFTDTLAAGRYAIVGMKVDSANVVAARLVSGKWPHRPGVPGMATYAYSRQSRLEPLKMGVFGEFDANFPPSIDILPSASVSNPYVYLWLIKVA